MSAPLPTHTTLTQPHLLALDALDVGLRVAEPQDAVREMLRLAVLHYFRIGDAVATDVLHEQGQLVGVDFIVAVFLGLGQKPCAP